MSTLDIVSHRLSNHHIGPEKLARPDQVVSWLGAVQAQDYESAKWAVGLRCEGATHATIEQAIAQPTIVRSWLNRGTLHIVAAADIRWMLALVSPRIIANSQRRHKQLELDAATLARSVEVLGKVLQGGQQLTRKDLLQVLDQAGIATTGQRGYHMLSHAALNGLICFGPNKGKQPTFVLLDEWVPDSEDLAGDEALAELARRYFTSHGPATLLDYLWWSGLPAAEARTGLETIKPQLAEATIDDQTYWWLPNDSVTSEQSPAVHLLPAFDQYFLGYTDRKLVLDSQYDKQIVSSNGIFRPMLVIDGQVVGIWKRTLRKKAVTIDPNPFAPLTDAEERALQEAAERYGAFLGLSSVLA